MSASIMEEYQYTPLDNTAGEIRLLELHPGLFDDPINISIITKPFVPILQTPKSSLYHGYDDNSMIVPAPWVCYENLDGYIVYFNKDEQYTTWSHPINGNKAWADNLHSRRSAQLEFEALSYTWNSGDAHSMIEIVPSQRRNFWRRSSFKDVGKCLRVGRNLYDALRYLRGLDTRRVLWIDALSINQNDLEERSQQVGRMGDIYKFARRVVVWLGLPSEDSSLALRVLARLGDQIDCSKNRFLIPAPGCTEATWWCATNASCVDANPETWQAVHYLLQRPWFFRLWVRKLYQYCV
jgi:hypothetical protein